MKYLLTFFFYFSAGSPIIFLDELKDLLYILNINPLSGLDITKSPSISCILLTWFLLSYKWENLNFDVAKCIKFQPCGICFGVLFKDLFHPQSQNILLHFALFNFLLLPVTVRSDTE